MQHTPRTRSSHVRTIPWRAGLVASALAAVLATGLTACGSEGDRTAEPTSPETTTSGSGTPETASGEPDDSFGDPRDQDDATRHDYPGPAVEFADGTRASADSTTFTVTTPADETYSVALPSGAEGWISDVAVDLGDAGTGYLVIQSAGEFYATSLLVLDGKRLYVAESPKDVPFGDSVFEDEPGYETFTTDDGAHLMTTLESGEVYEWSVEDGALVPTRVP